MGAPNNTLQIQMKMEMKPKNTNASYIYLCETLKNEHSFVETFGEATICSFFHRVHHLKTFAPELIAYSCI